MSSGWSDGYCSAVPKLIQNVNNGHVVAGINGSWAHSYPHMASPGPAADWLAETLKWWQYCLNGDTSMEREWRKRPAYCVYMQEREEPSIVVNYRPGRWLAVKDLSSKNIEQRRLYFGEDKSLSSQPSQQKKVFKKLSSPLSLGLDGGRLGYGKDPDYPCD